MVKKDNKNFISVVVCTYNRGKLLTKCLQSLTRQTVSASLYEVIIIDNNSTDDTHKIASQFIKNNNNFNIYIEKQQGLSYARNQGWRKAKGNYIAYIDDDAIADKEWLKHAYRIIKEYSPDIFGGPSYPYYLNSKPIWFKDEYETKKLSDTDRFLNKDEFIAGLNFFVSKKLLSELEGFNTQLGMIGNKISYHEETDFIIRAWNKHSSLKVYYSLPLKIDHIIRANKMTISFILKSNFSSGKKYVQINKSNQKNPLNQKLKSLPLLLLSLIRIPGCLLKGLFRDKNKYRYYKNYIKENLGGHFFSLGKVVGNLRNT